MPTFDVDQTEILAFQVDGTYLFKHYFENDDAFNALKKYYNSDKYRFEVPEDEVGGVNQQLDTFFCTLRKEDDLAPYTVLVKKGNDYSDILRNAVLRKEKSGYHMFLLKDALSVEQAIEQDAIPLEEADIDADL